MVKSDNPAWFTNPEHAHMIGMDHHLETKLRASFQDPSIEVDCGVDGNSYHFRIGGVDPALHGHVSDYARDVLSPLMAGRFEVQCV